MPGRVLPIAAALLVLAAPVGRSQSSPPAAASSQLETFLTQLQTASQSGDPEAVAAMIRYPITIAIGGLRVPFADAASVVARYDDIFNPPLREVIARASLIAEAGKHHVAPSGGGYVIGAGDIVITPFGGRLLISAIAVPPFEGGSGAEIAPQTGTSAGTARPQEPRRIAIRVGPRPTQIAGLLARDATDSYLLYLPKGQLAGVRLERVPAGEAVIRVVHARTGAPLGARPSADGRFVTGRPAEGADYRVEVRRMDNAEDAALPYMLSLTLR